MVCFKLLDDWKEKGLKKGDVICQDDFGGVWIDDDGAFFYADKNKTKRVYIDIVEKAKEGDIMKISSSMLGNDKEIDFTANYHRDNVWNRGRLSLRKRGERYQVYVHWYRDKRDEVLYSSEDLKKAVAYANGEIKKVGYDWEDEVVE